MRKLFLILMAVVVCSLGALAQGRTIRGTVVDAASNEPLIGVSVLPIGGGNGAATDIDGNFVLNNVPANVKKAKFSYVGYHNKEVELKNNMVVKLESSDTSLDDVVVVAYGTASKESLTGSVAVVGAKEIEDRPVTSVTAALEGAAPGVQVNNTTGEPGSSPSIRIRGFSSINGDNNPLYVVDGVIFSGTIADLNPQDIESMSVLKDAASAALYGAQGSNGVVLITTKRAKNVGRVEVTLNVSQGTRSLGLPLYERMEANEWMQYAFMGYVNGQKSLGTFESYEKAAPAFMSGFVQMPNNNIYGRPAAELYDSEGKFIGGNPLPGYTDLDWWDAVSRTGYRQEYNVNAAAATEKFNVFASVGYLNDKGYTIRSDFERFNGRINANFNPTSYLKLGVNLAATHQNSKYNTGSGVSALFGVLSTAPVYPYYAHDPATGEILYEDGKPVWNTAGYLQLSNPPYTQRLDDSNNNATVVDGNAYMTAVLPYGFEFTVRGAMHRDKTHTWEYTNNKWGSAAGVGYFATAFADIRNHQFNQSLYWAHDYSDHHIDALVNHENSEVYQESTSIQNMSQVFAGVMNIQNFSVPMSTGGGIGMERSERWLGRARYNYNQKYFAEASFTREGSSCFAKDHRWGSFWSAGASWIISKENFMQSLTWIDNLKFHASYGSVGNKNSAGAYAYWGLYGYGLPYGLGSSDVSLVPTQLAAPNVKWEATQTLDVGLEGSLFNGRLNFNITYFDKRNADQLMSVARPVSVGSLGYSGGNPGVLMNVGTMSNRGWELAFTGTVLRTRDIEWSVSLDATMYKNKIVELPYHIDQTLGNSQRLAEGYSRFEYYMYEWEGVDMLTGNSVYLINPNARELRLDNGKQDTDEFNDRVAKAEADGSLIEKDGKYYTTNTNFATKDFCGTALPTVYGSFGTNFAWKDLSIGVLFTYSLGGKINDTMYASYMSFGGSVASAMHKDLAKSWTQAPEGMTEDSPNRFNKEAIPQLNSYTSINNNTTGSTRWLTSADYLVLKNINVSYNLPQKWVRPLQLQNLNLGIFADNLFTVTARKGMNPQQSWNGSQGGTYGTARVFTFQVTAKF